VTDEKEAEKKGRRKSGEASWQPMTEKSSGNRRDIRYYNIIECFWCESVISVRAFLADNRSSKV
jgi:hypothetical protein